MLRTSTIAVLFMAFSCIASASEIEAVLEWQGTIHATDVENLDEYCIGFPGDADDIKKFFRNALVVNCIKIPKTKCSAEGVARNEKDGVVDWWLYQGGVGYVINKKNTTSYICEKGSKCCESLPHICNTQP